MKKVARQENLEYAATNPVTVTSTVTVVMSQQQLETNEAQREYF